MLRFGLILIAAAGVVLALVMPVGAVINVEHTVEKQYKELSKAVGVGRVTDVKAPDERRVITVALEKALKDKAPAATIRILIAPPASWQAEQRATYDVVKDVAVNDPVVYFLTEKGAGGMLVHIRDCWLMATIFPKGATELTGWLVESNYDTLKPSFPGRTSALVKMVNEVNAGTNTYMNKFTHKPFEGGMKKRGKIPVQKAAWVLADDFNGDKKADLLVGSPAGTQLFLAKGEEFEDATEAWGLKGAGGAFHAAGDVNGDGKIDLLLDGTVWINSGTKFVASSAKLEVPAGTPLAAALMDANDDQKVDAIYLTDKGHRAFLNPGSPETAWLRHAEGAIKIAEPIFAAIGDFGDTGRPFVFVVTKTGVNRFELGGKVDPAEDFSRLTGVDFKKFEKYQGGFKNAAAVTLSINGEGRPDVLIWSEAGSLLFVNRGLGTFFADETASVNLTAKGALPVTPGAGSAWCRANLKGGEVEDVILVGEDGTLYEMSNTK